MLNYSVAELREECFIGIIACAYMQHFRQDICRHAGGNHSAADALY